MTPFMPKAKPARVALVALLILTAFTVAFNIVSAVTSSDAGVHVSLVLMMIIVASGGLIAAWKAHERREAERTSKREPTTTR